MNIGPESKIRLAALSVRRIGLVVKGPFAAPMSVVVALVFIVVAFGAPTQAQNFDARCSDRTATGKFDCTIDRPIVNRSEFVYDIVQFAPGDTVYVNADGCVQTSNAGIGSGPTWKRYVNPSGDGSDQWYHGLVRIPTAKLAGTDVGNSMTRIKNVVGRPLLVTGKAANGRNVPASELVLHLGYEDDDVSDNSYNDHDDGTEDQCKGDGVGDDAREDGPAHVTITICRGESCVPKTSRYPFDVLSNSEDPNGFPLNPHWSWYDRPGNRGHLKIPETSFCHEFSKHDLGRPWYSPNFPDCTDQAGLDGVDTPDGVNWALCRLGKLKNGDDLVPAGTGGVFADPNSFAGHVNWFPVTVEGRAGPVSHEKWGDDDYDFSLSCDQFRIQPDNTRVVDDSLKKHCDQQDALYTNDRPYLHVEFDSEETVDLFTSDAWVDLKANVDAGSADSAAKRFGGHTIVTGLFGLDGEHELKSELHPLYAMATRLDNFDPADEVWLMFVRNRGDEGFCSSQLWDAGFKDYTFRLPWRDGMTSVEVNWIKTNFEFTEGTSMDPPVAVPPVLAHTNETVPRSLSRLGPTPIDPHDLPSSAGLHIADGAVFVTFHLGDSTASPFIDGALHLKWTGPTGTAGHTVAGGLATPGLLAATTAPAPGRGSAAPGTTTRGDDIESKLDAFVSRLPARERTLIQDARAIPSPRVATHRLAMSGPMRILAAPPATGVLAESTGPHEPVAGRAGPATRKLARDAAEMRALCAATDHAPSKLPPEVCGTNVRDHRTAPLPARDHRKPVVRDQP